MKSFKYPAMKTVACLFFFLLSLFQIQDAQSSTGVCNATTTGRDFVNAPSSNLCTTGSLTSPPGVFDNGAGKWQWTCNHSGSTGGTSPLCLADRVNCGTANNTTSLSSPASSTLCTVAGTNSTPTSNANNTTWSWQCTGYDSSNHANCSAKIPGNCGAATSTPSLTAPTSSLCSGGQSSTPTQSGDTWNWTCTGGDSSVATCSTKMPGVCGDAVNHAYASVPASNLCSVGTSSTPTVSGTQWQWTCTRASNGAASTCRADFVACGNTNGTNQYTQPTSGLCSNGTVANQQHNTTNPNDPQWTWDCVDYLSQSVHCYAHDEDDGTCGTAISQDYANPPASNLCGAGIPTAVTNDGSDHWKWSCQGVNGGSTATNCLSDIVNCGTAQGTVTTTRPTTSTRCSGGTYSYPVDTPPFWTWTCTDDIGDAANCWAYDSNSGLYCGSANGQTYDTVPTTGLCNVGTPSGVTESNHKWNWTCTSAGHTYSCSAYDLDNGVCGAANGTASESAPTSSLCSSGTATAVTDTGTTWTWGCLGINGGTDINSCSAPHITTGQCGTAYGGSYEVAPTSGLCATGVLSAAGVIADGQQWTWTCAGANGGNNASCTATRIIVNNYCAVPPFVTSPVQPNVMAAIDVSGSMGYCAYNPQSGDNGNCCNTSGNITTGVSACGWTYHQNEEGYFRHDKKYHYNSSGGYWEETATGSSSTCPSRTSSISTSNTYDGSCLNFLYMSRIDLLRWAMTGGRPSSCTGNSTFNAAQCDPELYLQPGNAGKVGAACNDTLGGCVLVTSSGAKVKVPWDRVKDGLTFQFQVMTMKPRMGALFFSENGVRSEGQVYLGDFQASNNTDEEFPYKNLITAINSSEPDGYTPTGPAMWDVFNYYRQQDPQYGGIPVQQGEGDRWKNPMYICDGGGANCTLISCAKNFVLLLTDGQWNRPSCSADADPVQPAYQMHQPFQNIATGLTTNVTATYAIGLFLGGTGEKSLKNVAMYGSFNKTGGWPDSLTGYPLGTCNMDDCSGTNSGSGCTALPASTSDWDSNGDGIPDTFKSAANASDMKNAIRQAIREMMGLTSSGTAVSVLSSSEGTGANLMQALFYPKRTFADGTEISWTSDLMNYWYYMDPYFTGATIREDTVREGASASPPFTLLDLQQDYITNFRYDADKKTTLADRLQDTNGDGSSFDVKSSVPIEESVPIWRAGFNLWWTDPTARNIYTSANVVAATALIPHPPTPTVITFDTTNSALIDDYLGQTASDANKTINYVRGYDCVDGTGAPGDCGTTYPNKIGRNRTVGTGVCSGRRTPCKGTADCPGVESCTSETHVWKLGDIISSTPRIMGPGNLNTYNYPSPYGYNDQTYAGFIKSDDYQNRQLAFVGSNDGMLHAFKLGKLLQTWEGQNWYEAGKQVGGTGVGGIGTESYAFIPKNVLPYLQYLHDVSYCHIYLADGPSVLTDVSINKPSTCTLDYWDCPKVTTMQAAPNDNAVNFTNTSWRTTLIGSLGIGGATCNAATPDADRISTPLSVSGEPIGWSSYFALDVTNQTAQPTLLWEFSNPDLGVTNVGPVIVKVGGKDKRCAISNDACTTDTDCGDIATKGNCVNTNGRWFAILASGSTGPISNLEFRGTSDKNLKLFVLDLKTGELLRTIDTSIANAFAGSLAGGSSLDIDRDHPDNSGNYQDDAVYVGYVQNNTSGGVLRLTINDDMNPAHWTVGQVIAGIGPVTSSVVNLLDRDTGKVWLYFGEGRYFYKQDDPSTQRRLFGIQDPCFDAVSNIISSTCTSLTLADLKDQTASPSATLTASQKGWYINMDAAGVSAGAERVISNPTPDTTNGAVYFISFAPTADVCGFGGTSYFWSVDYETGGQLLVQTEGKALVQVSTGEIKAVSPSTDLTQSSGRKSLGFTGIPPAGAPPAITGNASSIKKFMHVQEQ